MEDEKVDKFVEIITDEMFSKHYLDIYDLYEALKESGLIDKYKQHIIKVVLRFVVIDNDFSDGDDLWIKFMEYRDEDINKAIVEKIKKLLRNSLDVKNSELSKGITDYDIERWLYSRTRYSYLSGVLKIMKYLKKFGYLDQIEEELKLIRNKLEPYREKIIKAIENRIKSKNEYTREEAIMMARLVGYNEILKYLV
jgi:CBS domain-containing protein